MSHDELFPRNDSGIPSEEQIAIMLEHIDIRPSPRFYAKVEHLPWMKGAHEMKHNRTQSLPAFITGVTAALVCIISLTIATPTLRAAAAEWIGFKHADSNIIQTTTNLNDQNYAEFGDLLVADNVTPYEVREPTTLPEGYRFATGKHWLETNLIEITYRRPHPYNTRRTESLQFRQRLVNTNDTEPLPLVGADASIEQVNIGAMAGQYVVGGWSTSPTNGGPEQQGRLGWDSSIPLQRLRWQDGHVMLELQAGSGVFTKNELVSIAESVRITEK